MRPRLFVLVGAMLLAAGAELADAQQRPGNFYDAYRLLLDRNIFNRSRTRGTAWRNVPASTHPAGPRQGALILTGIMREGKGYLLFIEDTAAGPTTGHHIGDAIAGGTIASADMDHIDFAAAGGRTRVDVGTILAGSIPPPTTAPTAGAFPPGAMQPGAPAPGALQPGAAPAAGGAPAPSGGSEDEIIQRLKQRRMQEIKQ